MVSWDMLGFGIPMIARVHPRASSKMLGILSFVKGIAQKRYLKEDLLAWNALTMHFHGMRRIVKKASGEQSNAWVFTFHSS